jgi:quinol-cytochrome oxidoreductase complex cytochrome b subunit/coenzyme F420-reducing hydrogenase delta subunit/ferredoxin
MRGPLESTRRHGLSAWTAVERGFDAAFGSRLNPLRRLGAVASLAFALLAASGAVLYTVLDTSATGAHRSIEELTHTAWSWGSLLRGLHRYAADTFALAIGLHVLREWLHGHERGARRFSWLTGVPLVALAGAAAIGGFWLNWDQLGQYSAIATAEWLDALPLLATPLAANFASSAAVGDRLFSLFVFVHIGLPLMLVFGLWFHVQRLTRAEVLPPRALAWGTVATLLLLAGLAPVASHAPATLAVVPQALRLDWMLLWVHPLADAASPQGTWALVGAAFALLFALPFLLRQRAREPVALVDAAHCNGCRRCFADCPYAAITMAPHPNQRVGREIAVVDADLCAACGICAGACPSATPFRSVAALVTGIDMPQHPLSALRDSVREAAASRPIVVFGCDRGARVDALKGRADVRAFSLLCTGQLPPSFVEYALRDGAAGVVVAACREGGCEYRFGARYTRERLEGLREPRLRAAVDRGRLAFVAAGRGDEALLQEAIDGLRHA